MFSMAFGFSLFLDRIKQKNYSTDFAQNSLGMWHMGHGRNCQILMVIQITLRWG